MSESNSIPIGDGLKELLYHLSHIADQESALRQMMSDLASASDEEQRAAVLSRIDIEVIYHLGIT